MKASLEDLWISFVAHDWPAALTAIALKGAIILLGAWLLLRVWRNASAAIRHWVWLLALVSLFLLPFRPGKFSGWSVSIWNRAPQSQSNNELASVTGEPGEGVALPSTVSTATELGQPQKPTTAHRSFFSQFTFSNSLALVWLAGVFVLMIRIASAQWCVRQLGKKATPIAETETLAQLHEVRSELRMRREVRLLQSRSSVLPMTWGNLRPIVLLPTEAIEWSAERRLIVLRHELAHVKRWDCLAQMIAQLACAFCWFNPLAWLAARQMRIERERACDDLVLGSGAAPSSYAEHLLEIARSFSVGSLAPSAAIAMARPPQIAERIAAIVDARRNRRCVTLLMSALTIFAVGISIGTLSFFHVQAQSADGAKAKDLAAKFDRLKPYFAAKEKQARALVKQETNTPSPLIATYFDAAAKSDWASATNIYWQMRRRAYQFEGVTNADPGLETMAWQPVNETYGILEHFALGEEKYVLAYGNDIIDSIPAGSIYFGGTDPGRWLITGMSKSHENADPFFTLSQNSLADGLYLKYLRTMYGGKIYTPTDEDSKAAFDEYLADAQARKSKGQLRPGEDIKMVDGKPKASGQVAVMAINALLAKKIFDKNPDREFYIEESFPLEWMYPHLTPNGLIMKINRQRLAEIPDDVVQKDREYWSRYTKPIIGDWLNENTSVAEICRRAEKVFVDKDFSGYGGDPKFLANDYSCKMFSKLRAGIAGTYAWRIYQAQNDAAANQRMTREADFAFRQAYALCPYSPEALYRYVQILAGARRFDDALLLARTSSKIEPDNRGLWRLIEELEKMRASLNPGAAVTPRSSVAGRVFLRGTPPPERPITMDPTCALLNPNAKTRNYVVGKDGGLGDVFVYVKQGAPQSAASGTPTITLTRCFFEPYVLGVQAGQLLTIRNADPILENVHLLPKNRANRELNFALTSSSSRTLSFNAPEMFVQLKTDVHPWMYAYVCVLNHPWFAVTDKDGNFSLPTGLLPGHYTLAAAHRKAGEKTAEIDLEEDKISLFEFMLDVPSR